MELRLLRHYVAVAEAENQTHAASQVGVAQSWLSREMSDLESELHVDLFQRTGKSISLTKAGKVLLREARAVLRLVDEAVERTQQAGGFETVRVGVAPSLVAEFWPRALKIFKKGFPQVQVSSLDLSTKDMRQQLQAGRLDFTCAVPMLKLHSGRMTFEEIHSYPMWCFVAPSHPLAKKECVHVHELGMQSLVGYSAAEYPEYLGWLKGLLKPHGVRPRLIDGRDSSLSLIAALEQGENVAINSSPLSSLCGGRLKRLPIVPALSPLAIGVTYIHPLSKSARGFVEALKQAALDVR